MVYVKQIRVDNYDEFLEMTRNQKFTMAESIVNVVLSNLKTNRKEIPVFEIEVYNEDLTYTLSVQKEEFLDILEKNLIHFENEEAYEGCQKIVEAINFLKIKK
jgi:predicted P-loop ATPase